MFSQDVNIRDLTTDITLIIVLFTSACDYDVHRQLQTNSDEANQYGECRFIDKKESTLGRLLSNCEQSQSTSVTARRLQNNRSVELRDLQKEQGPVSISEKTSFRKIS